ncbi:ABC transporter permease [Spiribacter halobius]|uniref:TRAP transporter large permease protein n=2 Tax=Sediminicurvatus halobius TaxID=2182432 RepID=A0A2U2MXB3_9GAMM|nr:ABC transporter permease [Spiribacter halobius]
MSLFLLLGFFVLSLLGVPLAVSLGISGVATLALFTPMPMSLVPQTMFSGMNSFLLVAVPLFILVGLLMEHGGTAARIFRFANAVVGWLPGGLGHVNVVTSVIFGGISGSSVADIASLGRVEISAMVQHGYSRGYAVALTLTTSVLATIIPPSILMIIAGSVAGESIGVLLIAGLVPGVFVALLFMGYNHLYARRTELETVRFTGRELLASAVEGLPALMTPVILLYGIVGGLFTPTEAAGVAVLYTLFLSIYVFRELRWRDIPRYLFATAKLSGTILFIAATAKIAAWVFTFDGLPAQVASVLATVTEDPRIALLLIFAFLVIVGMFMDAIAALFVLIPILLPGAEQVGVDPIHFLVVTVIALGLGLITPPVGVCLFTAAQVANMRIESVIRASLPLMGVLGFAVLLLVLFPAITLYPLELLDLYGGGR